jgi:hypothetical protein
MIKKTIFFFQRFLDMIFYDARSILSTFSEELAWALTTSLPESSSCEVDQSLKEFGWNPRSKRRLCEIL